MAGCIGPVRVKHKLKVMYVPCGKCNFCLEKKRGDWTFRLEQELRVCESAMFLTLTYDNEHLRCVNQDTGEFFPDGMLSKRDLQLFTKRLRKESAKFSTTSLRYFSVGEYGTKFGRAHYHSIMFNVPPQLRDQLTRIWGLGHVYIGTVETKSIHYVVPHVIPKPDAYPGREPPFALMSKTLVSVAST